MWGMARPQTLNQTGKVVPRCLCACHCKREATKDHRGLKLCTRCYKDMFMVWDGPIWLSQDSHSGP